MDANRRQLMTERDAALKAGDVARFQALTVQIAALPLKGVKPLTQRDIQRYADRTRAREIAAYETDDPADDSAADFARKCGL